MSTLESLKELNKVPTVFSRTVVLNDAAIKSYSDGITRVPSVPALGDTKLILFQCAIAHLDSLAGAYTNIDTTDASFNVRLGDLTIASLLPNGTIAGNVYTSFSDFFGAAQLASVYMAPSLQGAANNANTIIALFDSTGGLNKELSLELYNGSGLLTGGNAANKLTFNVSFLVFDVNSGQFE